MNIHQLNVSYVQEQDRLLLRINTGAGDELRLWFTRRLTLKLLPALNSTSATQMQRYTAQTSPAASLEAQRQSLLDSFQKEAAAYQGDFSTPYQELAKPHAQASATRQGTEPWLISEVKLTLRPTGQLQLQLIEKLPTQTRDAQVAMDPPLTQGLLHLLLQALKKSKWLELQPAAARLEAGAPADEIAPDEADKPRYLN
ncbi:hypothetical protein [Polaromonas sp.]|uniref:hypothetical protein n=1 Tax=Polaromonas sp. TaxID=1869339 RepID=UPI00286D62C1|nr:hypothetical protein [Polaromonas sp.]